NAYATQVAYAMWGKNVQQVQYIVSRQNVIPFEERNDPEAERPEVQSAPTGWRATITEPGQSQQRFAEIFLAGVEASGQCASPAATTPPRPVAANAPGPAPRPLAGSGRCPAPSPKPPEPSWENCCADSAA